MGYNNCMPSITSNRKSKTKILRLTGTYEGASFQHQLEIPANTPDTVLKHLAMGMLFDHQWVNDSGLDFVYKIEEKK